MVRLQYIIIYKGLLLFVTCNNVQIILRIVTWNYNSLLRIIIIIIIISYLKLWNCLKYLKIYSCKQCIFISSEYLKLYNCVQINCITNYLNQNLTIHSLTLTNVKFILHSFRFILILLEGFLHLSKNRQMQTLTYYGCTTWTLTCH